MKTNKQKIEVQQAYENGSEVKRTYHTCHHETFVVHLNSDENIQWNWEAYDYDIVEEPVIKYMIVANNKTKTAPTYPSTYTVYEEAKKVLDNITINCKIIKLVQDVDFNGD